MDKVRLQARRPRLLAATLLSAALLSACGGGGGDNASSSPAPAPAVVVEKPATRAEAARFLTQATFGPTEADITRVMAIGYAAWIDEQLALPRSTTHLATFDATDTALKASGSAAGADQVLETFWQQAVASPDQLRQRMAYALQQIFVISLADANVANSPRAVAAWMDLLATEGLGNYRTVLEQVSRHPMMGLYLTHLKNQKADTKTGRVPDENYAREVMQLFSIGLVELNEDGTAKTVNGADADTYTPADISGLAKVFTGWSWACPEWPDNNCFFNGSANGLSDPDRAFKPMQGYPQYHSTEAKTFLNTTIAAQTTSNPEASLKTALDTLANHPNVGPFIGRQLIQRLVTSNPSPAYVRSVAQAFNNNGAGVRGDMKAVLKAVLMHPEARQQSNTAGKLREPVLRLSAFLRAFGHTSDSGRYRVGNTDSPATALGQSPMRAPSVFNFYRPGYIAPGTTSGAANLASPEMQIAHETSAAGYVNYMRDAVSLGVGASGNVVVNGSTVSRRDLQSPFTAELALADQPAALVDLVVDKLMAGSAPAALKTEITTAITTVAIPALNSTGSNQAAIDSAKRTRVNAAVLLVLASPEFQVQK